MTVTREVLAYYAQDLEHDRLREGRGRLEFWRTQDVLRRTLPPPPARVLDVGGGTGVHAEWLLADGYEVDLLDPVPLHVERAARVPGLRARVGDARRLPVPDGRADAVLLLGPLYHLADRADRLRALGEARRAVRPGGVVAAATINRYAAVLDTVNLGTYLEERQREAAHAAAADGVMLSPGADSPPTSTTRTGWPPSSPTPGCPAPPGTAWRAPSGCTATSRTGSTTRTAGPCSWTPSARWSRSPRSWAPAGTC
ncbi:class I SAM-dependent methyltransferase [Nonomuraea sp. NPDC004702]